MIQDNQKIELFRNVFRQHYPKIVYFALKYLKNDEEARDVAQSTFQAYWENIDKVEGEPLQYLFAIAKNKCLNVLRKQKYMERHKDAVASEAARQRLDIYSITDSHLEELFTEDMANLVDRSMASLPEKSREAFRLSREKGLTYKEIATLQGVSVKNIEYRISCVLRTLRKKLSGF